MSRRRGERSEKAEVEDFKVIKKRLRMLERENQRLRKELRKREVTDQISEERARETAESPKAEYKEVASDCTCVTITIRDGAKKVLMCKECKAKKAL